MRIRNSHLLLPSSIFVPPTPRQVNSDGFWLGKSNDRKCGVFDCFSSTAWHLTRSTPLHENRKHLVVGHNRPPTNQSINQPFRCSLMLHQRKMESSLRADRPITFLTSTAIPAVPAVAPSVPVTPPTVVQEVDCHNLEEEMHKISRLLVKYPFIAVDTEFPGTLDFPVGTFETCADYEYTLFKSNVDRMNIIQLGLSFFDENGNQVRVCFRRCFLVGLIDWLIDCAYFPALADPHVAVWIPLQPGRRDVRRGFHQDAGGVGNRFHAAPDHRHRAESPGRTARHLRNPLQWHGHLSHVPFGVRFWLLIQDIGGERGAAGQWGGIFGGDSDVLPPRVRYKDDAEGLPEIEGRTTGIRIISLICKCSRNLTVKEIMLLTLLYEKLKFL